MPNANKMVCPDCGVEMNHHANKVEYGEAEGAEDVFGGALVEAHACPECGRADTRPAAVE